MDKALQSSAHHNNVATVGTIAVVPLRLIKLLIICSIDDGMSRIAGLLSC